MVPPNNKDNVTPAQMLEQVVQSAVRDFEQATGTGPFAVKLDLYDEHMTAAMQQRLYTLSNLAENAKHAANTNLLEAQGIMNEVIAQSDLLKEILIRTNSLHDNHVQMFLERINSIFKLAVQVRNQILILTDMMNSLAFASQHQFDYDNYQLSLEHPELFEDEDNFIGEEGDSEGDPSHDGSI